MSINEPLTEYLPQVRCTPTLKARLERLAERSVTRNLADHIRFAVENYVDAAEVVPAIATETASGKTHPAAWYAKNAPDQVSETAGEVEA